MPKRSDDFTAGVADDEVLVVESKGTVAAQTYGTPPPPPSPNSVAKPLPVDRVLPEPTQPRRLMPSAVARLWDRRPESLPHIFSQWWGMAQDEMQIEFDLRRYVLDDTYEIELPITDFKSEEQSATYPISMRLLRLANFARTIRREGQINPIKVVRSGDFWLIEIGERRWTARHLLRWLTGGKDVRWTTILAEQVAQLSRARQSVENANREDLNAIADARQLALLLMAEYGEENFKPLSYFLEQGLCDRHFYAQVSDGEQYRVPKGKAEYLLSLMSLKEPTQLRQYRALLRLSDEAWVMGDDQNWTERHLRDVASQKADTVTTVTVSGKSPSPPLLDDPALQTGKFVLNQQRKAIFRELLGLKSGAGQAQPHTKAQLKLMIEEAENAINDMKKLL